MDNLFLAASNNNIVEDTSRNPSLVMANFKLLRQLDNKKNEIRRLKKSLKHKDQQILALRNYIADMKRETPLPLPLPNDNEDIILVDSFENMKVDDEAIELRRRTLEDVEEEI